MSAWPWNNGNYSWVAPTSIALLALKANGLQKESRLHGAVEMLLQRQLAHGGWNYGNTVVFNAELLPLPDTTGMALCALAGLVEKEKVALSLSYLQDSLKKTDSPLAVAWGILALKAWGMAGPDTGTLVLRAFEKAVSLQALNCESLGLLTASAGVTGNLSEVLPLQGMRRRT